MKAEDFAENVAMSIARKVKKTLAGWLPNAVCVDCNKKFDETGVVLELYGLLAWISDANNETPGGKYAWRCGDCQQRDTRLQDTLKAASGELRQHLVLAKDHPRAKELVLELRSTVDKIIRESGLA